MAIAPITSSARPRPPEIAAARCAPPTSATNAPPSPSRPPSVAAAAMRSLRPGGAVAETRARPSILRARPRVPCRSRAPGPRGGRGGHGRTITPPVSGPVGFSRDARSAASVEGTNASAIVTTSPSSWNARGVDCSTSWCETTAFHAPNTAMTTTMMNASASAWTSTCRSMVPPTRNPPRTLGSVTCGMVTIGVAEPVRRRDGEHDPEQPEARAEREEHGKRAGETRPAPVHLDHEHGQEQHETRVEHVRAPAAPTRPPPPPRRSRSRHGASVGRLSVRCVAIGQPRHRTPASRGTLRGDNGHA